MYSKKLKRQLLKKKLFAKSRLIILNEDSFEEFFSVRLTPMNVFVWGTLGAFLIVFITTLIIAFTPLREFIPGYSSNNLRKSATELALKSDSLSNALSKNDAYLKAVLKVLNGEIDIKKFNKDSILAKATKDLPSIKSIEPTDTEIKLRNQVNEDEKIINNKN